MPYNVSFPGWCWSSMSRITTRNEWLLNSIILYCALALSEIAFNTVGWTVDIMFTALFLFCTSECLYSIYELSNSDEEIELTSLELTSNSMPNPPGNWWHVVKDRWTFMKFAVWMDLHWIWNLWLKRKYLEA